MGCGSSKSVGVAVKADVYRSVERPSRFAVYDIHSIKEPWIVVDHSATEGQPHPTSTPPAAILDKLIKLETANDFLKSTWVDVSKAFEDLKPIVTAPLVQAMPEAALDQPTLDAGVENDPIDMTNTEPALQVEAEPESPSLHAQTALAQAADDEEDDPQKPTPEPDQDMKQPEHKAEQPKAETGGRVIRALKENPFIQRDREEREKERKMAAFDRLMKSKRDPFGAYPEKCPPGAGENAVVIYTTTLHGIRRTFEDCNNARSILESHLVVFDERNVALHAEFRNELKELIGEGGTVPQVFVKGRHLGGAAELLELNETGRLVRMLGMACIEKGPGRRGCEGCGGARFVPCLDCGGSRKVVVGAGDARAIARERCGSCNENGLVHCPACL